MTSLAAGSRLRDAKAFVALLVSFLMLLAPVTPAVASVRAGGAVQPNSSKNAAAPANPANGAAPVGLQPAAPAITATKTDSFSDPDNDGKVGPGGTISYEVA